VLAQKEFLLLLPTMTAFKGSPEVLYRLLLRFFSRMAYPSLNIYNLKSTLKTREGRTKTFKSLKHILQQKAKEFNEPDFLKSTIKRNSKMPHLADAINTSNKAFLLNENSNNFNGL